MNKLDRISAILVMLQSRSTVTARKIAEQFNVSMRTVYRDMRVIEESGVPVTGDAGIGYSLMEGYKLPPLMFTADEAISFLMAEKVVSRNTDKDNYDLYRTGMDKIRAVLRVAEKDILENIDDFIVMIDSYYTNQPQSENVLLPLLKGILYKKSVDITYHANYNQEVSQRSIEPVGLLYMSDAWYILAYCLLRNDYRTFKINLIKQIIPSEQGFSIQHENLKKLINKLYPEEDTFEVHIKTHKSALRYISNGKYINGLYREEDNGEYMDQYYKVISLEHFGRWYMCFADKARIIYPESLKDTVKELIAGIDL